jgi:hypothetical protein
MGKTNAVRRLVWRKSLKNHVWFGCRNLGLSNALIGIERAAEFGRKYYRPAFSRCGVVAGWDFNK